MQHQAQFQGRQPLAMFGSVPLQQSKSSVNMPIHLQGRPHPMIGTIGQQRPIMMPPHQMANMGVQLQPSHVPLVNSPSAGNVLHVSEYSGGLRQGRIKCCHIANLFAMTLFVDFGFVKDTIFEKFIDR
jgi:hypothetical protein